MSAAIEPLFSAFATAARAAWEQQDKWLLIDPVYEQLETLQAAPLEQVLPRILALVESYPELDYGGPGPFGSLIEEHPMAAYTPALLASLERQPSTQVIGWLDRTMRVDPELQRRDPNPVGPAEFALALEKVLQHPGAAQDCKEFAQLCLNDLK
ncbi:MAG: hypothetical protein JO200_16860 [Comamonas sp.]|jgi:hypothetical protein|nr:hypothetical protein [Comamonas sp.]